MSDLDNLDLDAELRKTQELQKEAGKHQIINKEEFEHNLLKILSIQDMMRKQDGVCGIMGTFYDDFAEYIRQYPGRFNRNLQYRMESFRDIRLDRIMSYALAYNSGIYEKLAYEEKKLLMGIYVLIDEYKKAVQGKIMV